MKDSNLWTKQEIVEFIEEQALEAESGLQHVGPVYLAGYIDALHALITELGEME